MKQHFIIMYDDSFNKIIEILEKHTESLNNYYDIEECVNLIHFLQKEIYFSEEQEDIINNAIDIKIFAEWVFNSYNKKNINISNASELLSEFYKYMQGGK